MPSSNPQGQGIYSFAIPPGVSLSSCCEVDWGSVAEILTPPRISKQKV